MLEGWANFYVIIGSSAAALTGLMFVVIALMPEARVSSDPAALDAFASPNIVHFSAVLLISAFITIPRHSLQSLRACLLIAGIVGLGYAILVVVRTIRQRSYSPVLEDWIFHAILPVVAYSSLFIASIFIVRAADNALVGIATSALLLLFIGIHNAWDAALWMSTAGRTMQDDERSIRELMQRWLEATKAGDLQTVLSLMTDDVIFLTATQPPMNKEKFAAGFKSFAGKVKFEAKQDVKVIHVAGDLAYTFSSMSIAMDGKTRSGNILSIFRRVAGKWLLSRDANFVGGGS